MGYGLRTHTRIYMKGLKICRLFYRNPTIGSHTVGGPINIHYCLIQMNKDRTPFEVADGEPPSGQSGKLIYQKFFRDFSESDETYRVFEDEELFPQTVSQYKSHKNCNAINPENGMFKLLMRKRFTLECPTAFTQQNLAGNTRTGSYEFKKYKPLKHMVTWENSDNTGVPERPIYELWWAYPKSPAQLTNVTGTTHYDTIATNTMYYKDVGHA